MRDDRFDISWIFESYKRFESRLILSIYDESCKNILLENSDHKKIYIYIYIILRLKKIERLISYEEDHIIFKKFICNDIMIKSDSIYNISIKKGNSKYYLNFKMIS